MKRFLFAFLVFMLAHSCLLFASCDNSGDKSEAGANEMRPSPFESESESESELPSQSEQESESESESIPDHTHVFDKQVAEEKHLDKAADCTNSALYFYSCECGENGTESFSHGEPKGHSFDNGSCISCGVNAPYTLDGDKVLFGSYPQTMVSDTGLASTLNSLAGDIPTKADAKAWTSYGYYISEKVTNYMWFIDVTNGDSKYRGVYFTEYRPWGADLESEPDVTVQDDNGYELNTVYWFKYEPLTWTILSEDDGSVTILCDYIIDAQEFDYKNGSTKNNYKSSTVRAWLNDTFYETAFDDAQKELIMTTVVNNGADTTGYNPNSYACDDTEDKIFLLSRAEATNFFTDNADRKKQATDYAKSQGSINLWWLRSPYKSSGIAGVVEASGVFDRDYTECTNRGIVPALRIKLTH